MSSNPWATLSGPSVSPTAPLPTTAELDSLLSYLKTTLGFLSRTLGLAPLRRITRAIVATISTTLWDRVLTSHSFSTAGAAQLSADLSAVCDVVDSYVGAGVAERGLHKCLEGVQLISLPVKGSKMSAASRFIKPSVGGLDDDEWSAWDAEAEDPTASVEEQKGEREREGKPEELGLWEVEKRLFENNEEAREVLEDLRCELLTEGEARNVLRRRIELGS